MTFTFPIADMMQAAYDTLFSGLPIAAVFLGAFLGLAILAGIIVAIRS